MEIGENGKYTKNVQKHVELAGGANGYENVTARLHLMVENLAMSRNTRWKMEDQMDQMQVGG